MEISKKNKALVEQYAKKAWVEEKRGNYSKALKEINKALNLFPKGKSSYGLLIHKIAFLRELKKYKESETLALKLTKKAPKRFEVWSELGLTKYSRRKYRESVNCFKKAVNLKQDFNLYTLIANAELTFNPRAALADANKALRLKPKWREAINIRNRAKKLLAEEKNR